MRMRRCPRTKATPRRDFSTAPRRRELFFDCIKLARSIDSSKWESILQSPWRKAFANWLLFLTTISLPIELGVGGSTTRTLDLMLLFAINSLHFVLRRWAICRIVSWDWPSTQMQSGSSLGTNKWQSNSARITSRASSCAPRHSWRDGPSFGQRKSN